MKQNYSIVGTLNQVVLATEAGNIDEASKLLDELEKFSGKTFKSARASIEAKRVSLAEAQTESTVECEIDSVEYEADSVDVVLDAEPAEVDEIEIEVRDEAMRTIDSFFDRMDAAQKDEDIVKRLGLIEGVVADFRQFEDDSGAAKYEGRYNGPAKALMKIRFREHMKYAKMLVSEAKDAPDQRVAEIRGILRKMNHKFRTTLTESEEVENLVLERAAARQSLVDSLVLAGDAEKAKTAARKASNVLNAPVVVREVSRASVLEGAVIAQVMKWVDEQATVRAKNALTWLVTWTGQAWESEAELVEEATQVVEMLNEPPADGSPVGEAFQEVAQYVARHEPHAAFKQFESVFGAKIVVPLSREEATLEAGKLLVDGNTGEATRVLNDAGASLKNEWAAWPSKIRTMAIRGKLDEADRVLAWWSESYNVDVSALKGQLKGIRQIKGE